MSDNQNQISGWAQSWIMVGRNQPGGDWIIRRDTGLRVGAAPLALPFPLNDNRAGRQPVSPE